MQKRHRVFLAINLPKDIQKELGKHQERLAQKFYQFSEEGGFKDLVKWVKPENLHITLEFLGDLTDVEIAEACETVKEVVKNHEPFSISLKKIAYGPDEKNEKKAPKMIWVLGEKTDEAGNLKKDLQDLLLKRISFKPETRGFIPHITLARIKEWQFKHIDPEERPEISQDIDLVFTAESIEVMESELKRSGPMYAVLESHILGEEN